MKYKSQYLGLALAGVMAVPGMLCAEQQDTRQSDKSAATSASTSASYVRLSEMLGTKLTSTDGQQLGELKDIVLSERGRIQMAVVGVGGFLGIGEKLAPVPWTLVQTSQQNQFVLNIDRNKLESGPQLGRDNFDLNNPDSLNRVYSHYGASMPEAVGGTSGTEITEPGGSSDSIHIDEEDKSKLDPADDLDQDSPDKDSLDLDNKNEK